MSNLRPRLAATERLLNRGAELVCWVLKQMPKLEAGCAAQDGDSFAAAFDTLLVMIGSELLTYPSYFKSQGTS